MRIPPDYRPLYKAAMTQGWEVSVTGSGHLKWTNPAGRSCFSPSTPSDYHGYLRVVHKLKALGLIVKGKRS